MAPLSLYLTPTLIQVALGIPLFPIHSLPGRETTGNLTIDSWLEKRQEPGEEPGTYMNTAAIVGLIAGCIVILVLVILLFSCGWCKRYPGVRRRP